MRKLVVSNVGQTLLMPKLFCKLNLTNDKEVDKWEWEFSTGDDLQSDIMAIWSPVVSISQLFS